MALQDALGLELGFRVPEYFLNYEPELWEGLLTVYRLQEAGVATGFGEGIKTYPDEPSIFQYFIKVRDAKVSGGDGGGCDFFSRKKALWAAIGEAVERYALNHFSPEVGSYKDASFKDLYPNAMDIFKISGISKKQREENNSIFNLKFDENSIFRWVKGYSLARKQSIWTPLQLNSFTYKAPYEKKEPLILRPVSTGAAAHTTLTSAILNGLLEVIQRDAFMITWVNKLSPISIDKKSIRDNKIQEIIDRLSRYNLELHLLHLPSDLPVHTVLAVIIDRSGVGPAVAVGASANFNIYETIIAAASEAFVVHLFVRYLWDQWKKEHGSVFPSRDKLDRDGRLIWWATPERIEDISFLLAGEQKQADLLPHYNSPSNPKESLENLVRILYKKKLEVIYTEILEGKIKKALGLYAVMVTVPGTQPLHLDESLPYFYGERMSTVPTELGIGFSPNPNLLPHPFP